MGKPRPYAERDSDSVGLNNWADLPGVKPGPPKGAEKLPQAFTRGMENQKQAPFPASLS